MFTTVFSNNKKIVFFITALITLGNQLLPAPSTPSSVTQRMRDSEDSTCCVCNMALNMHVTSACGVTVNCHPRCFSAQMSRIGHCPICNTSTPRNFRTGWIHMQHTQLDYELKVKYSTFYGTYETSLADAVVNDITRTDSSGAIEQADEVATNAAKALGKLMQLLAIKGLIDLDEIKSCLSYSVDNIKPV